MTNKKNVNNKRIGTREKWWSPTLGCLATVLLGMTEIGRGAPETRPYDVVVYGGSAGGAIAATVAAREGASVALIEPGRHIGGLVTGGLGATDFGNKNVIGGMSREFFVQLGKHYGQPISWYFEPHVAEKMLNDWVKGAGVAVFYNHRLDQVTKEGNRIVRIQMENGTVFSAGIFLDSSYEGDLMARANVTYTWGREGQDQYGESLAGVRERCQYHQFDVPIPGRKEDGTILPCVFNGERGRIGQADRKVQAYNFRICLCNRKENQAPFPRPEGYDPTRYEILRRYLAKRGTEVALKNIMNIVMMPNGKTDVNNNGPFSTDHIGGSWDYPNADYQTRRRIWDDHVNYVQGFFYFLANDPSVPEHIQNEMNKWGLAKDEFVDNGHWPYQLYIREARRMVGEYVMIQQDLQTNRTKPDSIGMGSYNSDSHHVQRVIRADGMLENEGDMQVPVKPYEIAFRALLPKRNECENLLVPVCFSASHVAYSSMRMEPQYMIMGEAAGLAAAWSAKAKTPVQEVNIVDMQKELRARRAVLSLQDVQANNPGSKPLEGIVIDNIAAVTNGEWRTSISASPFVGIDYLHDNNMDKGRKTARFIPDLPREGNYEVRIAYSAQANRASNVPIVIHTTDETKTVILNQKKPPSSPPFSSLGTYRFAAGQTGWVEVRTDGTDGHVIADAVQWLPKAN